MQYIYHVSNELPINASFPVSSHGSHEQDAAIITVSLAAIYTRTC